MGTISQREMNETANDYSDLAEDLAQLGDASEATEMLKYDDADIADFAGWDEPDEKASSNGLLTPEDQLNLIEHRATSTQPLPRLIIAGGMSLLVGFFFFLLVGGKGDPQNQPLVVTNSQSDTLPDVIKDPAQAEQIEALKTRQALDQQNQQGQAIQLNAPKKPLPKTAKIPTTRPVVNPTRVPPTRPTTVAARPIQSAPVVPSAPAARPILASYSPPPFASPVPQENPASALKRLTELGVIADGSNSVAANSTPTAALDAGYQNASYIQEETPATGFDGPSSVATSAIAPGPSFSIQEGSMAKATLQTPIIWNSEIDISNRHFKATLSQAFGDIPKGAIVTLQPDPAQTSRQSGLLQLIATSFQVKGEERPVTAGIDVVASDNAPVQAKLIRPGSGFGLKDVVGFMAGTAQTAFGGGLVGSNSDFGTQVAINAGNNVLGRVQQSVYSPQTADRSYFKFSGSIKLIANQNLSL
ncbi:MAG: hypothetical protein WCD18_02035 [Thermosynechococcaceae cyanobacterium]